MNLNITIAGTGNVGTTLAADLSRKGHMVTVLKTSDKYSSDHYDMMKRTKTISVLDDYTGNYTAKIHNVTESFEEVVSAADVIIICVQTNYHEEIIRKMSSFLKDGQIIMFVPGYLSTCYVLKHCSQKLLCIEMESSPIDCRLDSPCVSNVLFKNVINPVGVYPKAEAERARKVIDKLGFPYRLTSCVTEAALHNPNLIVHTVGSIFSIPRIEITNGEYWMYREVFTPHVWNVCESLDDEKISVMRALGIEKEQRYVEACQERNFINDKRSPLDAFFDYAKNSSPKGPSVPDSRYITEDVSQGLVLLESLGAFAGVPTPTCTSLINIANAALATDFRKCGRTISKLGIENVKILN